MKYQIIGYSDLSGSTELHECDDYNAAKGWVVGYVRDDGLRLSGHEEILIQNQDGEPQSAFDAYGWTHY